VIGGLGRESDVIIVTRWLGRPAFARKKAEHTSSVSRSTIMEVSQVPTTDLSISAKPETEMAISVSAELTTFTSTVTERAEFVRSVTTTEFTLELETP